MRKLLYILLLLPFLSYGQADTCRSFSQDDTLDYAYYNGTYKFSRLQLNYKVPFNPCNDSSGFLYYDTTINSVVFIDHFTHMPVALLSSETTLAWSDTSGAGAVSPLATKFYVNSLLGNYITASQLAYSADTTSFNLRTWAMGYFVTPLSLNDTANTVRSWANSTFQPIGNYATTTALTDSVSYRVKYTDLIDSNYAKYFQLVDSSNALNGRINAKGTGSVTSITATAPLTGGTITSSGNIGLGTAGTAGTYGSATQVPVYTTDAYGRITATTVTAITYPTYNSGYGISITGTAPTFTVSATPYTAGRGMGINGFSFYSDSTVCLYADDSNVNKGYCSYYYARNNFLTAISLTAGSGVTITGVSPTYTISATPTTYYAGSNISVSSYSVAVVSNPTFTGLLTGTGGITTPTMTVTGPEAHKENL